MASPEARKRAADLIISEVLNAAAIAEGYNSFTETDWCFSDYDYRVLREKVISLMKGDDRA